MSQYVNVKLNVLDNVKESLIRPAIKAVDSQLDVRYKNNEEKNNSFLREADIVITKAGSPNPLRFGFKLDQIGNQKKLSVVGDFWQTGYSEKEFVAAFGKQYQILNVAEMARANAWSLVSRVEEEDEEIVLRYAV